MLQHLISRQLLLMLLVSLSISPLFAQSNFLTINKTPDFTFQDHSIHENWANASWITIPMRRKDIDSAKFHTKLKILYSETGIYFLFDCKDQILNASMKSDFMKLWKEDVVEIFLWPDEDNSAYFEYELSPLNFELPILVSNKAGEIVRWRPFMYQGDQTTRHITYIEGGPKQGRANITKWIAKIYIPYKLLRPLNNIQPKSGTTWRANFYRVDYDNGKTDFAWQPVNSTFHEYDNFGAIMFE